MELDFIVIHLAVILFISFCYLIMFWKIPIGVLLRSRINREHNLEDKHRELLEGVKVLSYRGIYPNSLSYGNNRILITKNIIDSLDTNELRCLLSHHTRILKKGGFIRFLILSVVVASSFYLLYLWLLTFVEQLSYNVDVSRALTFTIVYLISVYLMGLFRDKAVLQADKHTIQINDRNSLLSALEKVTKIGDSKQIWNRTRFALMGRIRCVQKMD